MLCYLNEDFYMSTLQAFMYVEYVYKVNITTKINILCLH